MWLAQTDCKTCDHVLQTQRQQKNSAKYDNVTHWATGLTKFRLISTASLSPVLHTNSASMSIRREIDILSACNLITFYVVDVQYDPVW